MSRCAPRGRCGLSTLEAMDGSPQSSITAAQVKELVSAISGRQTFQSTGGTGEAKDLASVISVQRPLRPIAELGNFRSSAIQLLLPDGGAMTVSFDTPTRLTLEGWGCLDLGSTDFYDKMCAMLSKREGKPVKLTVAQDAKL